MIGDKPVFGDDDPHMMHNLHPDPGRFGAWALDTGDWHMDPSLKDDLHRELEKNLGKKDIADHPDLMKELDKHLDDHNGPWTPDHKDLDKKLEDKFGPGFGK